MSEFLNLERIDAYTTSFDLSNAIWDEVIKWDWFQKQTVGSQLVRATDSISANIAEGFGRYGKKEKIQFYRYAMGSMKESQDWIAKCKHRKLIDAQTFTYLENLLDSLPLKINSLIKFTNDKLQF